MESTFFIWEGRLEGPGRERESESENGSRPINGVLSSM